MGWQGGEGREKKAGKEKKVRAGKGGSSRGWGSVRMLEKTAKEKVAVYNVERKKGGRKEGREKGRTFSACARLIKYGMSKFPML
jgi:hypothetical protein